MTDKAYKVNKGEWSEFYTLLKLLAEQRLYAADEQLRKLEEIYYPVLKVITADGTDKELSFELNDSNEIKVYNPRTSSVFTVKRKPIADRIYRILESIKTSEETSFEIPLAETILEELGKPVFKGYSNRKSDIVLKLHDIKTGHKPEVGFSIKSQIGGASTLSNAGEATNFTFKIKSYNLNPEKINSIDTHSKIRDRVKAIYDTGSTLEFFSVENKTFRDNLMKIDSLLPSLVAEMILIYYKGDASMMKDINSKLGENKFNLISDHIPGGGFYEFKIKNFLLNTALGMTPATAWDGQFDVHGGYIIVRKDGEIVCYHLYNFDAFREYLYSNTKLETPSSTRHKFGQIYEAQGDYFIKLNLQIRFTD